MVKLFIFDLIRYKRNRMVNIKVNVAISLTLINYLGQILLLDVILLSCILAGNKVNHNVY